MSVKRAEGPDTKVGDIVYETNTRWGMINFLGEVEKRPILPRKVLAVAASGALSVRRSDSGRPIYGGTEPFYASYADARQAIINQFDGRVRVKEAELTKAKTEQIQAHVIPETYTPPDKV